jgi:hypothetical protein
MTKSAGAAYDNVQTVSPVLGKFLRREKAKKGAKICNKFHPDINVVAGSFQIRQYSWRMPRMD